MPAKTTTFERVPRFYQTVDVAPAGDGFAVRLDGRSPRSPGGAPLVLPTEALAQLLAAEWDAQRPDIEMAQMAATRLAYTAIDGVPGVREQLVDSVVQYAASDGLCYFAEYPSSLTVRQEQEWGPLLDWAQEALGLRFLRAAGIIHRPQPAQTLDRVAELAGEANDFNLAGLAFGAPLLGSTILAFALQRGRLDAGAAFALSRLDEDFQERQWGVDAEAAEANQRKLVDIVMLANWFAALL